MGSGETGEEPEDYPACHPLLQDCARGDACYPYMDAFACVIDASRGEGNEFDSCEFVNVCNPGFACVGSDLVGDVCDGAGAGCCTQYCDLVEPDPCDGGTCSPWFGEGDAPPGLENVGVCTY